MERSIVPPGIDRELVEYLRMVFRDQLPPLDISDRELGAKIGEQRVINHLAALFRQQQEDLVEDVLQLTKNREG